MPMPSDDYRKYLSNDDLAKLSGIPYPAPVGKRWVRSFDWYGTGGDRWYLDTDPAYRGSVPWRTWSGQGVESRNFIRNTSAKVARPWWKRVLWLPWKKY